MCVIAQTTNTGLVKFLWSELEMPLPNQRGGEGEGPAIWLHRSILQSLPN